MSPWERSGQCHAPSSVAVATTNHAIERAGRASTLLGGGRVRSPQQSALTIAPQHAPRQCEQKHTSERITARHTSVLKRLHLGLRGWNPMPDWGLSQ
eukprot:12724475-Alexandrium_andersonii.AAC.2